MKFPQSLRRGRLIRRYKRFLADVEFETGETATVMCPNTGSLLGLAAPGATVWMSTSASPTRKYAHTWEMVEADAGKGVHLVGINTGHPNKLIAEAIAGKRIAELTGYTRMRGEVKYGIASRIDLLLEDDARGLCYVEIKNVHMMRRPSVAEFPDCVTRRAAKHLDELAQMVAAGHRGVMLFLIQRADAEKFTLARDIDPALGAAFDAATAAGVEMLAYRCQMSPEAIVLDKRVRIVA